MTNGTLELRPVQPSDRDFLLTLYGEIRGAEMAMVPWTEAQKNAFVLQQFDAQHAWWTTQYPTARFDLVLLDGCPVGRLYVDEWEQEIRVIDVALVARARGRGLGSRLLRAVFRQADEAGKPVSIHVEQFNPARRLYERLGFNYRDGGAGVYLKMVREPEPAGRQGVIP